VVALATKRELVGVKGKKWNPEKPFGTVLIPGGAFIMGRSSDDPANAQDANNENSYRSFFLYGRNRNKQQ